MGDGEAEQGGELVARWVLPEPPQPMMAILSIRRDATGARAGVGGRRSVTTRPPHVRVRRSAECRGGRAGARAGTVAAVVSVRRVLGIMLEFADQAACFGGLGVGGRCHRRTRTGRSRPVQVVDAWTVRGGHPTSPRRPTRTPTSWPNPGRWPTGSSVGSCASWAPTPLRPGIEQSADKRSLTSCAASKAVACPRLLGRRARLGHPAC